MSEFFLYEMSLANERAAFAARSEAFVHARSVAGILKFEQRDREWREAKNQYREICKLLSLK